MKMLEFENSKIFFASSTNMEQLEDESIALVVTSPPYFNYIEYGNIGTGTLERYEDYLQQLKEIFNQCHTKLIPGGKFCLNITNMKSRKGVEGKSFLYSIVADVTKMMQKLGFIFFDEIIWIKADANAGALNGKPLFGSYPYPPTPKILDSIFENILIFYKEGKLNNRFTSEQKLQSILTANEWKIYTKGIWQFGPDKISDHPASYPIELPKRLIRMYSFKGEKVLDPFVGTGTTVFAAMNEGRIGFGYEIFEGYEKFIKEKYELFVGQQSLF